MLHPRYGAIEGAAAAGVMGRSVVGGRFAGWLGSPSGGNKLAADRAERGFAAKAEPEGECRNGRLGPLTVAATLTRQFMRTVIDGKDLSPIIFVRSAFPRAVSTSSAVL